MCLHKRVRARFRERLFGLHVAKQDLVGTAYVGELRDPNPALLTSAHLTCKDINLSLKHVESD